MHMLWTYKSHSHSHNRRPESESAYMSTSSDDGCQRIKWNTHCINMYNVLLSSVLRCLEWRRDIKCMWTMVDVEYEWNGCLFGLRAKRIVLLMYPHTTKSMGTRRWDVHRPSKHTRQIQYDMFFSFLHFFFSIFISGQIRFSIFSDESCGYKSTKNINSNNKKFNGRKGREQRITNE